MTDNQDSRRRSFRLKEYDYSQSGAYFVTICTQTRACLLGEIVDGEMRLSEVGRVVADAWKWLAVQYPHVELDISIVMPNHLHGIIMIHDDIRKGGSRAAPTELRKPLGQLIGAFKTVSTKRINEMRLTSGGPFRQRNYYEHVIRNEADLAEVREYILNNPVRWNEDENNPASAAWLDRLKREK